MVFAVGAEFGLVDQHRPVPSLFGAEFGLVDQHRPVPSLFGAEFVGPKQAGAEDTDPGHLIGGTYFT